MAAIKEYQMTIFHQDSNPTEIDKLFERTIIGIDIPPCPIILNKFMAEAAKEDPNYALMAGIVEADVAISASLIKTANSPFFGIRQRVRSVKEALAILGMTTASRAIAGIILRNTFPTIPNMERFWDASTRIARLSGWLAQYYKLPGLLAEDAYTFGLFRDCGIPVLLKRYPHYNTVLAKANQDVERGFIDVEEAELPTNHAILGCILAQSWWLPEDIFMAIRHHHDLSALNNDRYELSILSRNLIATSQLAEHIVQHQLGLSLTQEWSKLGHICLRLMGINKYQLEELYAVVESIVITED